MVGREGRLFQAVQRQASGKAQAEQFMQRSVKQRIRLRLVVQSPALPGLRSQMPARRREESPLPQATSSTRSPGRRSSNRSVAGQTRTSTNSLPSPIR